MNWFFIALINPLAHSVANHFDKYLLSKHIKGGTVGALIVFSSLFAVFALPVIILIKPNVLSGVTAFQAIILILNGSLVSIAVALYLYALELDEASYVAPFFQFYPVFGFIFSYLFLGEVLTVNQMFAALFIVLGSLLLSVEFTKAKAKFKSRLVLLMIGSCFFYAINAVIFKYIAVDQGFMNSLFWDMTGKFLFGVTLFFSIARFRNQFLGLLEFNGVKIIVLNVLSELVGLLGELAIILAVLYAPVALVQSVTSVQPLFVLILGVIITIHFPRFGKEEMSRRHMTQKITGISIVTAGVLFLSFLG